MKLPYWETPEEEARKEKTRNYVWERKTGLKRNQIVQFETKEFPETDRETKGNEKRKEKKIREGKLIKFYEHFALFDFGVCRRCINNEVLERMAQEGVFKIDW